MEQRLSGKHVVVTGGGIGIGRASAERLQAIDQNGGAWMG